MFSKLFAICLKCFPPPTSFSKFWYLFRPVPMHPDALGCIGMRSDSSRRFRNILKIFEHFEKNGLMHPFFLIFGKFWRSWSKMDLKINLCIKFCSRYTYSEVRVAKDREKSSLCHRNLASVSPSTRTWAFIYGGLMPSSLLILSTESQT